jgi:hypothetical protein
MQWESIQHFNFYFQQVNLQQQFKYTMTAKRFIAYSEEPNQHFN